MKKLGVGDNVIMASGAKYFCISGYPVGLWLGFKVTKTSFFGMPFTEVKQLGEFTRLQKELEEAAGRQTTSVSDLLSSRGISDIVEEISSLMVSRDEIAAKLKEHGYEGEAGREKLCKLFAALMAGGASQWVGKTYVAGAILYDPKLLEKVLQIEASDAPHPKNMAWAAIEHVEGGS
jgi:hypothetical protein